MPDDQVDPVALQRLDDFGYELLDAVATLDDMDADEYRAFLDWVEADRALCSLSQLSDDQLVGLETLVGMSDDEVTEFSQRLEAAWDASQRDFALAIDAVAAALREQAAVEVRCGEAARRRFLDAGGIGMCVLNDDERNEVHAAMAVVAAARQALAEAAARKKAGVTPEQMKAA